MAPSLASAAPAVYTSAHMRATPRPGVATDGSV